jgi:hypothetical protein
MSVYSCVSPAIAAFRLFDVLPIGRPVAGSPYRLEVFQMAMRVAGLAFGGRAEHGGDIVVAFDVGLLGEIQIAAIGLRFAGKRGLEIALCLGTFQIAHDTPLMWRRKTCPAGIRLIQRYGSGRVRGG